MLRDLAEGRRQDSLGFRNTLLCQVQRRTDRRRGQRRDDRNNPRRRYGIDEPPRHSDARGYTLLRL